MKVYGAGPVPAQPPGVAIRKKRKGRSNNNTNNNTNNNMPPGKMVRLNKMVVYIFVHPTINVEGIKWHLQQLYESHANIEKVVFIESYREDAIRGTITIKDFLNIVLKKNKSLHTSAVAPMEVGAEVTDNIDDFIRKQYYPPEPENPQQYLPNLNLELDLSGYTDYFENVNIHKGNLPTGEELGYPDFQIESYFLSGDGYRVTGIGCKRFLSQLLHLYFNPNMLYCAIDGFTLIYEVQYVEDTGKILSPYEVERNRGIDSIIKDKSQRPPKKYSDVISEYYEHNKDTFGIFKGTDNGKDSKRSESIKKVNTTLQKFLILTPVVLNQVFYDPLCTDFKEDVDFFNRLHQFLYAGDTDPFNKCTKYFSCKLDSSQSEKGINKYTGVFSPENFKNYRYLYRRFLIDAIKTEDYNILRWYGLFMDNFEGENVVRIIPNITVKLPTAISKVQLELELDNESEENKLVSFPAKTSTKMILNVAHDNYKNSNEYYPITIFGLNNKKSSSTPMNNNTGVKGPGIASTNKKGRCDFKTYDDKMINLLLAMVDYFSIVKENNKFQVTGIRETETETVKLSELCIDCGDCKDRKFKRQKDGNSFSNIWVNSLGIKTPVNPITINIDNKLIKYLIMICAGNERIIYSTEKPSINENPSKRRRRGKAEKIQTRVFIPEQNLFNKIIYRGPVTGNKRKSQEMSGGSRKHTKKRQYHKKTKRKINNKSKNNRTKKTNKKKTHKK